MEMLMTWFLDADFQPEYLELPAGVHSGRILRPDDDRVDFSPPRWQSSGTLPFRICSSRRLDRWTHNKTDQKAIDELPRSTGTKGISENAESVIDDKGPAPRKEERVFINT